MLSKMLVVALLSGAFVSLSGCNTVRGVGRDIESAGNIGNCPTKVVIRNGQRVRVCR